MSKRSLAEDLPAEWTECFSEKQNRKYWYNNNTHQSVWEEPIGVIVPSVKKNVSDLIAGGPNGGSDEIWEKKYSITYKRDYWYNALTNQTSWEQPVVANTVNKNILSTTSNSTPSSSEFSNPKEQLLREKRVIAVNAPTLPRLIQKINIPMLWQRFQSERASMVPSNKEYKVIFALNNDDIGMITRAIQEDEILKTKLKLRRDGQVVDLPSFLEVWHSNEGFRQRVISSKDPDEEKWACQRVYSYKLATTFMPGYAKALYEYFRATKVLDPCAGWGDRLLGALGASFSNYDVNTYGNNNSNSGSNSNNRNPNSNGRNSLLQYTAFDPNTNLRCGYSEILQSTAGIAVQSLTADSITFKNNFRIFSQPFEVGALQLENNSFDFVFTSPPFFDYEMYNPNNPNYRDWIKDFYVPLMVQCCRVVQPGCYVAIHIGDTSAGSIVPFLTQTVQTICSLSLMFKIGLTGIKSNQLRDVWIFQKPFTPVPMTLGNKTSGSTAAVTNRDSKASSQLSFSQIQSITNPPLLVRPVQDPSNGHRYILFDDSVCIGGTKQRLLGRLLATLPQSEVVYAGPDGGLAQVALAFTAKLYNKQATVFLNTYEKAELPPLVQLASLLGVNLHLSNKPSGRTLKETQAAATEYVSSRNSADCKLMPFGLKANKGEELFELFTSALLQAIPSPFLPNNSNSSSSSSSRGGKGPGRLWMVVGSGFLMSILHNIWPDTHFCLVQVGKKVFPDQISHMKATLYIANEHFTETAIKQPPYSTVPWYDAKLWQFVEKHGVDGDYIWNVGTVPGNKEEAVRIAMQQVPQR